MHSCRLPPTMRLHEALGIVAHIFRTAGHTLG